MAHQTFKFEELHIFDSNALAKKLGELELPFAIVINDDGINHSRDHYSISRGLLKALFIGQEIAKYSLVEAEKHYIQYNLHIYFIVHSIQEMQLLCERLIYISKGLYEFETSEEGIDPEDSDVMREIDDFDLHIEDQKLIFYELADDYFLNYVSGLQEISGFDEEPQSYLTHPEWKFGFIKPYKSMITKDEFYVSPNLWIVPHKTDIAKILAEYSGFKDIPILKKAYKIEITDLPAMIFNDDVGVPYPHFYIEMGEECAQNLYSLGKKDFIYIDIDIPKTQTLELSSEGEILIVSDTYAKYVFFPEEASSPRERKRYLETVASIIEKLQPSILGQPNISCSWDILDDEKFEQLCYDVIYYSKKFDSDTIKKMGKSRSRDGGRDIEVLTVKNHFSSTSPEKWIAQCKFMRGGGSLSGTKLINVSDMIEQYNVDGLMIMTNGIIDSTLYDKLEAITKKRNVKLQTWSVLELERFIARYPLLRKRYFPE